ncbi:MAG: VTT domain-containing protein [Planctomycetes bacterium]|nr:VTT domain-containing protein [Planctomycetota bacterium]
MTSISDVDVTGSKPRSAWLRRLRLSSLAIIVLCALFLVRLLPVDRLVSVLSTRVESLGVWGPVVFAAAYVVAAVFFVPGSALTLSAGAVFSLFTGTLLVSLASTAAAAVSFLIGRYVARDAVRQWAVKNPRFAAIDRAIGQGGWKIIALLRLSPAVPFSLGNYLFGLTSIRFWPYVLTSWLAMLPGTFMYVYLGYAGRAGLHAASGGGGSRSAGQWALLVVGLIATIVVTVYVTRLARKAIAENDVVSDKTPREPAIPVPPGTPSREFAVTMIAATFATILAGVTGYAYAHRAEIKGLFGPPSVTLAETYAEKTGGPTVDHSAFDALLRKHVSKDGMVDYGGMKADGAALDAYIASLAKVPIDDLGRSQRLALLINGYNAFTVRLILDYYPIASIKDIPADKRWDDRRWTVGGNVWSLNQIEHEQIRPHFREPRVHFALVCAAIGCPPLRDEAYGADRLEKQLEAQAVYVHARDLWFHFDAGTDVLKLTSLYNWYSGDFDQVAGSATKYAAKWSPALKAALEAGGRPKVEFLKYDWSLNDKETRR